MKKTLSVLVLILLACTTVFAASKVSVSVDPYSLQAFTQKDGDVKETTYPKYGFGAGAGYDYNIYGNFNVGGQVKFATYYIEEQKNFIDVTFIGKAGYTYNVSEMVSVYANGKAALDLQIHNEKVSAVFEFGPELGVSHKINDTFSAFASCELLMGFPRKDGIKYSEFRVTPSVGVSYAF